MPVLIVAAALAVWLLNPESHINEAPAGAQGSPGSGHLLSAGGSNRSQYWQAALNAFASKPVTGIGAGNFALYWNAHPEVALPLLNAHSLYLETLAELGILGLLFVLGFFATAAWAGWRARDGLRGGEAAPALAVLGAGAVTAAIEWSFQIPAAFVPVIVVAGLLTAAPLERSRGGARPEPQPDRPSPFGLGIAIIGIAWASIWAAGILLISDYEARRQPSRRIARRSGRGRQRRPRRGDRPALVAGAAAPARARGGAWRQPDGGTQARPASPSTGRPVTGAPGPSPPGSTRAPGICSAAGTELLRAAALSPTRLPNEFVDPIRQEARKESSKPAVPLLQGKGGHQD